MKKISKKQLSVIRRNAAYKAWETIRANKAAKEMEVLLKRAKAKAKRSATLAKKKTSTLVGRKTCMTGCKVQCKVLPKKIAKKMEAKAAKAKVAVVDLPADPVKVETAVVKKAPKAPKAAKVVTE